MIDTEQLKMAQKSAVRALPPGAALMLLVVSGSHSYGLAHAESDIDIRGVYVLPDKSFLAASSPQLGVERNDPDLSMKEVSEYVRMLAKGNPHVAETVWAPADMVLYETPAGKALRDIASTFVSERTMSSYYGYLTSQCKYLMNMDPGHRRYEKVKRHIARLHLATQQLAATGEVLVRLSDSQVASVRERASWSSRDLTEMVYAETTALKIEMANSEKFEGRSPTITFEYQDRTVLMLRQLQKKFLDSCVDL